MEALVRNLTWSKGGKGAVLLKPGQDSSAEFIHRPYGDHTVVRLEQLLNNDAKLEPKSRKRNKVATGKESNMV